MEEAGDRWPALEASPEGFTSLVQDLGVPASYSFTDVFSLDPEALAFVPRPVKALILAYEDGLLTPP